MNKPKTFLDSPMYTSFVCVLSAIFLIGSLSAFVQILLSKDVSEHVNGLFFVNCLLVFFAIQTVVFWKRLPFFADADKIVPAKNSRVAYALLLSLLSSVSALTFFVFLAYDLAFLNPSFLGLRTTILMVAVIVFSASACRWAAIALANATNKTRVSV